MPIAIDNPCDLFIVMMVVVVVLAVIAGTTTGFIVKCVERRNVKKLKALFAPKKVLLIESKFFVARVLLYDSSIGIYEVHAKLHGQWKRIASSYNKQSLDGYFYRRKV